MAGQRRRYTRIGRVMGRERVRMDTRGFVKTSTINIYGDLKLSTALVHQISNGCAVCPPILGIGIINLL